ncbi:oligoribonuclease-like protein [Massariosphaeria phaeospora]|uniref:Oligoribonuclease-like protein n=1 Tax=Massariosphaeria phaeospora TaxID=100035 RepID=A0A7C8MFB1_9PLEO|nr:oligoribonuclease-like protein [Massariosphaeria phaeospora]
MASEDPLVWIDCEMTGLDPETESIMSIACFVTDHNLNLADEDGYEVVIRHSKDDLDRMGEWCTKHHDESGLTQACLNSTTTPAEATEALLQYIKKNVPKAQSALLAGNSVHADRSFLVKAPYNAVIEHLHYRILDVSSIKEAARRWAPVDVLNKQPRKKMLHEARADILESIEEARFYREVFFLQPS